MVAVLDQHDQFYHDHMTDIITLLEKTIKYNILKMNDIAAATLQQI
jgi:hypothetical protein